MNFWKMSIKELFYVFIMVFIINFFYEIIVVSVSTFTDDNGSTDIGAGNNTNAGTSKFLL